MRKSENQLTWLTAAQCAKRFGVSVRTLRLYEESGLIRPHRNQKNWRFYGASEAARLNEILALKKLGLSLQNIALLLANVDADLERMLAVQELALQEQLKQTQQSLALVSALRSKAAEGKVVSIDELAKLSRETKMDDSTENTIAWRRYEQARPRTERAIDKALYADYAGHYLLDNLGFTVERKDDRLFAQITGQPAFEIFAEDVDKFFYKAVQAQITFVRDTQGAIVGLTLHQNGHEVPAKRAEKDVVEALAKDLSDRISKKQPFDIGESTLLEMVQQFRMGTPDCSRMTTELATVVREHREMVKADLEKLGTVESLTFKGVSPQGWDVYEIGFERGKWEWTFVLNAAGEFSGMFLRPIV